MNKIKSRKVYNSLYLSILIAAGALSSDFLLSTFQIKDTKLNPTEQIKSSALAEPSNSFYILKTKLILQLNEPINFVTKLSSKNEVLFDESAFSNTYKMSSDKSVPLQQYLELTKSIIHTSNRNLNEEKLNELSSMISYIGIETFNNKDYFTQWLNVLSAQSSFKKNSDWQAKHFFNFSMIDYKYRNEFNAICPLYTKAAKTGENSDAVGLYYSACYSNLLLKMSQGNISSLLNFPKSKPPVPANKIAIKSGHSMHIAVFTSPELALNPLGALAENFAKKKSFETEGKQKIIKILVFKIASTFFDSFEDQKSWIETELNASFLNKSFSNHTGPKNTSLNPSFLKMYQSNCNLPSLESKDLSDTFTSLYVSACMYKASLESRNENRLISALFPTFHTPIKVMTTNSHMNITQRIMDLVQSPLPSDKRYIQSIMLSFIAEDVFEKRTLAKDWPIVLGIESKFDNSSESPVGAVGIGQLMPAYSQDFGSSCGLGNVSEPDIHDNSVNAYLSACYFKYLNDKFVGLSSLSLVAYNAGPNSRDVKNLSNLSSIGNEPANYVSKYNLIKDLLALGRGRAVELPALSSQNQVLIELKTVEEMRKSFSMRNSFFQQNHNVASYLQDVSEEAASIEAFPSFNQN